MVEAQKNQLSACVFDTTVLQITNNTIDIFYIVTQRSREQTMR